MNPLQTDNAQALRLFFQEEIYMISDGQQQAKPIHINYLGGNNQKILVLLKDTLDKELHSEERKLLMAILDAIKIKVADYAIVFWDQHQHYNFHQITSFLDSQKVLSFGMTASDLGLDDLAFNVIHQIDGLQFILTSHLTELKSDVAAKKAYWKQLKTLFP